MLKVWNEEGRKFAAEICVLLGNESGLLRMTSCGRRYCNTRVKTDESLGPAKNVANVSWEKLMEIES